MKPISSISPNSFEQQQNIRNFCEPYGNQSTPQPALIVCRLQKHTRTHTHSAMNYNEQYGHLEMRDGAKVFGRRETIPQRFPLVLTVLIQSTLFLLQAHHHHIVAIPISRRVNGTRFSGFSNTHPNPRIEGGAQTLTHPSVCVWNESDMFRVTPADNRNL